MFTDLERKTLSQAADALDDCARELRTLAVVTVGELTPLVHFDQQPRCTYPVGDFTHAPADVTCRTCAELLEACGRRRRFRIVDVDPRD